MSPENKQRIVGIIVLIAFVILLIPFLFTNNNAGKRHKAITDDMPIAPDKRQLINQQIQNITTTSPAPTASTAVVPTQNEAQPTNFLDQSDEKNQNLPNELTQTAVDNQTSQVVPPPLPETESAPVPTNEPIAETDKAGTDKLVQAVKVTSDTEPKLNIQPNNKPSIKKVVVKQQNKIKTKVIAKPTKKVKAKTSTATATTKKESWSIQLGSFSSQASAQKLITTLQTNGYRVFTQKITSPNNKELTRILVAKETDKGKAIKLMQKLAATLKIKGHLIRT